MQGSVVYLFITGLARQTSAQLLIQCEVSIDTVIGMQKKKRAQKIAALEQSENATMVY